MTAADGSLGSGASPGHGSGETRLPVRIIAVGIAAGLVVGGLLGALVGSTQSRTYQATTIASVLPDDALTTAATVSGTASTENSSDFIQGELVVITSQGLRTAVQKKLGLAALPSVSASQSGTTDIVDITATAATAVLAQRIADTTRSVYAQQRARELTSDVSTATSQVENQITAVRKQVAAAPGTAANANSPLEQEYARLLAVDSELALDSAQSASAVSTIQTAVVGGGGLSDTATYGAAGAVLGILLAAVGLIAWRRLRPRIYDGRDLAGYGADLLTPVLPAAPTKAVRAARVLSSGMRGDAGSERAVVLVATDGGSGSRQAVAAIAVAFHDASPVLVLAQPGGAAGLLAALPAGSERLTASELQGRRAVTSRLAKLSAQGVTTRLAVLDANSAELMSLASADILTTAAHAGWTVVADTPPLGESRLAVVFADRAGSATVLVAQGGTHPTDIEATVAALRGAGIMRLSLLLHEQTPMRRRLAARVGRSDTPTAGRPVGATPTGPRHAGPKPAEPQTTPQQPTGSADGAEAEAEPGPETRTGAPAGNVRTLRALLPASAASSPDQTISQSTERPKPSRAPKRVRRATT